MRFEDKVVMVTGGARGIGFATVQRFAREGAAVAVCDKDHDGAIRATERLAVVHSASRAYPLDVGSIDSVQAAIDAVVQDYGRIDVLVNNAGITIPGPVVDFSEADWDLMVDINLKGVFRCAQRVARLMQQQGSGRIINISSESGKTGKPLFAIYAATKFGVIGFTQGLAMELAPHGITVNAVCPGIVRTEMWMQLDKDLSRLQGTREGEALEMRRKSIPLGRLQEPEDVAGVVAFLASDDAAYMTGQAVNVTGGREVH